MRRDIQFPLAAYQVILRRFLPDTLPIPCARTRLGAKKQANPVAQNGGADTDLTAVKAALAGISDTELAALIGATYGVPQAAPGLPAWIEHACD